MIQPAVHVSEIKAFLRCRLSWFWSAPPPRGLNLEPIIPRTALHQGRLIHEALQIGYDTDVPFADAYRDLARKASDELGENQSDKAKEQAALGLAMLRGYQTWAANRDQGTRFLTLETSWEGVHLTRRISLAGRFDAVVEREDGLWILDFKTTSFVTTDWTTQDLQATTYIYAARRLLGKEVRGIIFRFLLKKAPRTYEQLLLKNGNVTRRKEPWKFTTFEDYCLALAVATLQDLAKDPSFRQQLGVQDTLRPSDYATILEGPMEERVKQPWYPVFKNAYAQVRRMYHEQTQSLKGKDTFFWDVEEYRTKDQIRRCVQYVLLPAAREITSKRKGRWIGPTGLGAAFSVCRNCQFKRPCELLMRGADYKEALRTEYREKEVYRASA